MGSIIVGQKKQKTVDMGGVTIVPNSGVNVANKGGMTAEEKKALVVKIMQMPKDQIVSELRKHGFNEIADVTEVQMKEVEKEAQVNAREKRLSEIKALPAEEQLPLLLEEGFTEEAQKLSEQLAKEKQEHIDEGTGEENTGHEETVGGEDAELNENGGEAENAEPAAESEKKKGGRPKKTESK
jgi:hypothetical protein